jgi:hypothetical protein
MAAEGGNEPAPSDASDDLVPSDAGLDRADESPGE